MTDAAARAVPERRRFTIGQTFFAATLAVAVVVTLGFSAFLRHSRVSILEASAQKREIAARRVEREVVASLGGAELALENVERLILSGAVDATDTKALEVVLFAALVSAPHLAEVTFTLARSGGHDADGEARLSAGERVQLSVFRTAGGHVSTRMVRGETAFVSSRKDYDGDAGFSAARFVATGPASDPTAHPTFSVVAAERNRGRLVWSDLHYSEFDSELDERRVVLSVQKAVLHAVVPAAAGGSRQDVLGVIRVALLTRDLDAIARARAHEGSDPHRVALLAVPRDGGAARLVARVGKRDRVQEFGDELRIVPENPPEWLSALLGSPLTRGLHLDHPNARGELWVRGQRHLATLRELSNTGGGTAGWLVAVVVPESHYTADLVGFERTFLVVFAVTLALVLAIGGATLAAVRRGLAQVVETTAKMRRFDFASASPRSRLREVDDVMLGLERAKTVARAMGKYVPLDLVRGLHEKNQEPALGGQPEELTLLFTDIEGFTALSERLPPDELAARLGDYLEAVTSAVQRTSGTIDKYIGDAVMAFWNAPAPVTDHAVRACEAVLECKRAVAELYASPAWAGLPPLTTRFGVHQARVLVGNFGAQSRLSYTALGDGVNLAARLEPLCKQYGVTVLVSETVREAACNVFSFRRIDRVAVKGKTQGIDVYELLGPAGTEASPHVRDYERAFDAYLELDFDTAIAILDAHPDDAPSAVLAARCREYAKSPPPAEWNRVHVAHVK